jgi:hypothetical protein
MNIGEASAVTTLVQHLTEHATAVDIPDDVVLAVVELNGRARKALGAGVVLPTIWMMCREEIIAARKTQASGSPTPRRST